MYMYCSFCSSMNFVGSWGTSVCMHFVSVNFNALEVLILLNRLLRNLLWLHYIPLNEVDLLNRVSPPYAEEYCRVVDLFICGLSREVEAFVSLQESRPKCPYCELHLKWLSTCYFCSPLLNLVQRSGRSICGIGLIQVDTSSSLILVVVGILVGISIFWDETVEDQGCEGKVSTGVHREYLMVVLEVKFSYNQIQELCF